VAIVILHNLPSETASWRESDAGVEDQVSEVASGLRALGVSCRIAGVRRLADIPGAVAPTPSAIVFNLVEALEGDISDFNLVPAVCRALGMRCTGAGTQNLLLTFDKGLAKHSLSGQGIRVPDGIEIHSGAVPEADNLPPPPWIVKPLRADGSEGILDDAVTADHSRIGFIARRIRDQCGCPAMVEEFIEGSEFGVSLLAGPGGAEAMPVSEIDFSLFPGGRSRIVDYAVKWVPGTVPGVVSPRRVPAHIAPELAASIQETARRAWLAAGCAGYARVDFRMDVEGRLFVIEINSNPDVSARGAFRAAIKAAGITWPQCLVRILDAACV
jgi:D-alanine-D-alanine ligase